MSQLAIWEHHNETGISFPVVTIDASYRIPQNESFPTMPYMMAIKNPQGITGDEQFYTCFPSRGLTLVTYSARLTSLQQLWKLLVTTPDLMTTLDSVFLRIGEWPTNNSYDIRMLFREDRVIVDVSCRIRVDWGRDNTSLWVAIAGEDLRSNTAMNGNVTVKSNPPDGDVCVAFISHRIKMLNADGQWVPDERLKVLSGSGPTEVQFESNFFGTFSSEMLIPPNSIDFRTLFDDLAGRVADNWLVCAVVAVFLLVWLLGSAVCWRCDCRDARYSLPIVLPTSVCAVDDAPTATATCHVISVSLGFQGERLDDDLVLELYDNRRRIDFHRLTQAKMPGKTRVYEVRRTQSIEKLTHAVVKLPVNCRAKVFVEEVTVQEKLVNASDNPCIWHFACQNWLGDGVGDGSTARLVCESTFNVGLRNGGPVDRSEMVYRHVLLSVWRRKSSSLYSRAQRFSVLAYIFSAMMIFSAMFYYDADDNQAQVSFQMGPLVMNWPTLWKSSMTVMIVYPTSWFLSFLFKRRQRVVRVVGWLLTVGMLAASCFFSILYSLEWGKDKATQWITSFFLSFIQAIIFVDPIILFMAFLVCQMLKKPKFDISSEIPDAPYVQGNVNESLHLKLKKNRKLTKQLMETVMNLTAQLIFLCVVSIIADDGVTHRFRQSQSLRAMIRVPPATYFKSHDRLLQWLDSDLRPTFYPDKYYSGASALLYDRKFVLDGVNLRMTPLRLKQARVHSVSPCLTDRFFPAAGAGRLRRDCLQAYDSARLNGSQLFNHSFGLFRGASEHESDFWGELGKYSPAGYSAVLGQCPSEVASSLRRMRLNRWLDRHSSMVFVESLVYNANTNLFTLVKIVFEGTLTGIYVRHSLLFSFDLYVYNGPGGSVLLLCQVLFLAILIFLTVKFIVRLWKNGFKMLLHFWNLMQLVTILLSTVALAITIYKCLLTIKTINILRNSEGSYISFDRLLFVGDVQNSVLGLLSFVVIVQLLEYLKLNRHISVLASTLRHVVNRVLSFGLAYAIIITGTTISALVVIGDEFSFRSFRPAVTTFCTMSIGLSNFNLTFVEKDLTAKIFYTCFVFATLVVQTNMLVVLIMDSYENVVSSKSYQYDSALLDHIFDKTSDIISRFTGIVRRERPSNSNASQAVEQSRREMEMETMLVRLENLFLKS